MAHLCLNCGGSLGTQHLDGLEDVHYALIPHPLQHNTEGDEHSSPSHSSTVGQTGTDIFRARCQMPM